MKNPLFILMLMVAWTFTPSAGQVPADRESLLNGEGAGMAIYAELNGYPGPKHALELQLELKLTADQRNQLSELVDDVRLRARALGKMVVKVEEEMHYAFSSGMIGVESLEDDAEQAGKLRGTLRGVHLAAHIRAKEILTPQQLKTYMKLRKEIREMKGPEKKQVSPDHR